jgi:hypothetical protein
MHLVANGAPRTGEHLVKNIGGSHDDHEWTSVAWHAAQLAFSLFLTVALFAHGAIGLPFLVLGLWKMGFPCACTRPRVHRLPYLHRRGQRHATVRNIRMRAMLALLVCLVA